MAFALRVSLLMLNRSNLQESSNGSGNLLDTFGNNPDYLIMAGFFP